MILKFRAWDTFDEDMVNDIFFSWQDCGYESLNECLSDERWKFMQSTGLFDVNGKEIFEGDVIVAMSQGVKATGEVKRRIDGYWLMYPSYQNREFWHIVENVDTGETGVEIIGNVYENPELLEVDNGE